MHALCAALMSLQEVLAHNAGGKAYGGQGFYLWQAGQPPTPNPAVKSWAQVCSCGGGEDCALVSIVYILYQSVSKQSLYLSS